MTFGNKEESTPNCETNIESCPSKDRSIETPLFERPWDEFVIKRDSDGKFRNFLQCCGFLTPV